MIQLHLMLFLQTLYHFIILYNISNGHVSIWLKNFLVWHKFPNKETTKQNNLSIEMFMKNVDEA